MGLKSIFNFIYPYTNFNKNEHKLTPPIKFFDPQLAIVETIKVKITTTIAKQTNNQTNKQTKTKNKTKQSKTNPKKNII